jgi:hypothetical protein
MAYRVRAGETSSVTSGRTRRGDLLCEAAPRLSDVPTPKRANLPITFPSARRVRKALVQEAATTPVRHAVPFPALRSLASSRGPRKPGGWCHSGPWTECSYGRGGVVLCSRLSRGEGLAEGQARWGRTQAVITPGGRGVQVDLCGHDVRPMTGDNEVALACHGGPGTAGPGRSISEHIVTAVDQEPRGSRRP